MKSRGGPPLWLMNSRGGPPFLGCMLMNSRGGPPILRGGPPLGTISMDQTVLGMLLTILAKHFVLELINVFFGTYEVFGKEEL